VHLPPWAAWVLCGCCVGAWQNASGAQVLSFPQSLANGRYRIAVQATDAANFSAIAYSSNVTVDTTGPVIEGPVNDTLQLGPQPDVGLSNRAGVACVAFAVTEDTSELAR
jgi:hypothetical protein